MKSSPSCTDGVLKMDVWECNGKGSRHCGCCPITLKELNACSPKTWSFIQPITGKHIRHKCRGREQLEEIESVDHECISLAFNVWVFPSICPCLHTHPYPQTANGDDEPCCMDAEDIRGTWIPLSDLIVPVIPPSNVDTDMKAFMFIMSIPFISGTWMSRVLVPSDLIETKEGTLFDHAICFAAFLGSLGYNALVLLGVCPDRRKHVSVISLADTNYIWDFHTGEVHTIGDAFLDLNATRKFSKIGTCTIDVYEDLAANDPLEISTILPNNITPYEKILVLFTIDGIWENIQTVPPANTLFDFWDPRLWRPISTGRSAKPNHPPVLYTPSMGLAEIDRVDREFERRICAGVEWVRQSRGMDTRWIGAKEKAHLFKRLELQCECDKSLGHEKSILNSRIREWDRLTCEAIPKGCRCKGKCIRYWMI
eukprot:GHVO01006298.1.p1 GENE.GHVO01006298.1~~GHVO01006298.1.p1  ORF type:complete len:425 (+),score=51.66 GHVO01006298.1:522-1796(+)